jgi:hypothetical protein
MIIYPNGSFHGLNIIIHSDRVEVRHGPQRISGKIRKFVDLDGDFDETRALLLAAIQPIPCLPCPDLAWREHITGPWSTE